MVIKMICANKKGQAVAEMAIFGTLILLVFGVLISFIQQLNDRQYVQMEAFRRALEKANSYIGNADDGAGASVQYTLVQNRHQVNLSGGYGQGSNVTQTGSANVYWAIPKSAKGSSADSLLVYRVNEDEGVFKYNDYIRGHERIDPETGEERPTYWVLQTENMNTESDTLFNETNVKSEDTYAITNQKTSKLKDDIVTAVPYKIVEKRTGDDDYESPPIEEGILYEVKQGVYLDSDGQYKYSQEKTGNEVTRGKTWVTPF
ncbi:MAG: hypothetical protein PHC71_02435 [Candidatus Omnitrophica bacterium]|nr:hypothetical protein [Candidatus Omnitrophota bacterium]